MRLFDWSAMMMSPDEHELTPEGELNLAAEPTPFTNPDKVLPPPPAMVDTIPETQ